MFRKNNIKITANKVSKMNLYLEPFYHLCAINKCVDRTKINEIQTIKYNYSFNFPLLEIY